MGQLTTHVLDTARGLPAQGLKIDLVRCVNGKSQKIKTVLTNADGRCDTPLLDGEKLFKGQYQLIFYAGNYLRQTGEELPEVAFLDEIIIAFGINSEDRDYHVPLLFSPYGYSTYRGS